MRYVYRFSVSQKSIACFSAIVPQNVLLTCSHRKKLKNSVLDFRNFICINWRGSLFMTPLTFLPSNSCGMKKDWTSWTAKFFEEVDLERSLKITESSLSAWVAGVVNGWTSNLVGVVFNGWIRGSVGVFNGWTGGVFNGWIGGSVGVFNGWTGGTGEVNG